MNTNEKDLSFVIARGPDKQHLLAAFNQQCAGEERPSVLFSLCREDSDGDTRRNLVVRFQPTSLTYEDDSGDQFLFAGFLTLMPIDLFSEFNGPMSVIYARGHFNTESSHGHLELTGERAADFHYLVNEILDYFEAKRVAETKKSKLNELFLRFGLFD